MKISLIAAMSENHVIGLNERLPWGSLPKDWENLFEVTKGCKMIMGRKSYDSEDRISSTAGNYVISRQENLKLDDGFILSNSLIQALNACENENEVFVIGGGEIFKEAILLANTIHLTLVHANFNGDAFFPVINQTIFNLESKITYKKDEKHAYDFSFIVYKKV